MNNRIFAVLAALIMVFTLAVNASAAEDAVVPDLTQRGSLTLTMEVDGKPLDNGRLNMYRVADVSPIEGIRYDFRLLDALTAVGATLDTEDLFDESQAQTLLEYSREAFDMYYTMPIEDGKVRFADLEAGLYLVWQRPEDASKGYDAISPFLISVPKLQDGAYTMDVEAKPKVPFVTEPSPPPYNPPPPPNLPQTGQLNWPVAVMAGSGAVLLIVGLILCTDRKRRDCEK